MAAKMVLCAGLSPDRAWIDMRSLVEGREVGSVKLESADVDEFIQRLASLRSEMADPVPVQLEPLPRLSLIACSAWATVRIKAGPTSGPVLALRHPGLGWLSFIFPTQEGRKLGQFLVNLAAEHEQNTTDATMAKPQQMTPSTAGNT
ncbi:MAG: hypothetical protein ACYCZB_17965 [Acidiphilium sp.]